jgi:hypothetical protein
MVTAGVYLDARALGRSSSMRPTALGDRGRASARVTALFAAHHRAACRTTSSSVLAYSTRLAARLHVRRASGFGA